MLQLNEIKISDKDMISSYLRQFCSENSEMTFTNLFMWRKSYDIRYALIDGMLCIMPKHGDGPRSATYPIGKGDVKDVINKMVAGFEARGELPLIRMYNADSVDELNAMFPGRFIITEDVNSFDYVYSVEDLINLSGKKYHGKKNHINKFKSLYNWEYVKLAPSDKGEVAELFESWFGGKPDDMAGIDEGREAAAEVLANWGSLDITGAAIKVDGKMAAVSFAEPLCRDMVVVHLEFADTRYEGAFPMINREFLANEWSGYTYVNREEDLGLEGLRRAKQSYHPVKMTKKYVATLA